MERFLPPRTHRKDFEKAIEILREEGCHEIYLFGSIAIGAGADRSDIDFGIRSFPRDRFFHIYGRLLSELDHDTDLIDFERQPAMFETLSTIGEIRRIA